MTNKTDLLQAREVICELLEYVFANRENGNSTGPYQTYEDTLISDTVQYLHSHLGMDAAAIAARFDYEMTEEPLED